MYDDGFFPLLSDLQKKTLHEHGYKLGLYWTARCAQTGESQKKILSMIFSKPARYSSFGFLHVLYLLTLSWLRYLTVKTRQMMYIKESHLNKCS